jgi:hypothetical protein
LAVVEVESILQQTQLKELGELVVQEEVLQIMVQQELELQDKEITAELDLHRHQRMLVVEAEVQELLVHHLVLVETELLHLIQVQQ